ncbi:MAG: DUF6160 family protein, partial [Candidatus Macondimonas sp.]
MVSNMKKTLAGLALAALPLMASAQMDQMQDSALANVSGQLGIIDITNIGFGVALFDVPGAIGPALIDPIDLELTNFGPTVTPRGLNIGLFDTAVSVGPSIINFIDWELTNFGPTLSPFDLGIKVGLFDVIPGVGPALIDLPEATFKASVLGGIGAAIGTTYILQNGLVLPIPRVSVTPTRVL